MGLVFLGFFLVYIHINSKKPFNVVTLELPSLEKSNVLAAWCFIFIMVRFWTGVPFSVVIIWNECLMCKGHRLGRQTDK